MIQSMKKRSIQSLFFLIFLFLIFPSNGWSYTVGGVEKNGTAIKQEVGPNRPLVWNPETGPLQDNEPFRNIPLSQVEAFCRANPARSNSGGGGGGCSLNPFIREAKAQAMSSNGDGVSLLSEAWGRWRTQAAEKPYNADTTFITTASGPALNDKGDVNLCNADQFIDFLTQITSKTDPRICGCLPTIPPGCNSTCKNPIIFDTNGELIASWGYDPRTTLGVTSLVRLEGETPGKAVGFNMVINGLCLEGSADQSCAQPYYDVDAVKAVMTHEIGHALGLGHSQVNKPVVVGMTLQNPGELVTMYPGLFNQDQAQSAITLKQDDLSGYFHLYGNPAQLCSIQGTVFSRGGPALRCAEVVAREIGNDKLGAISFVSGGEVVNNGIDPASGFPSVIKNSCAEPNSVNCGNFTIQGLRPGKSYKIEVNPIPTLQGGSNIGPCGTTPQFDSTPLPDVFTCTAGKVFRCGPGNDYNCPQVTVR